NGKHGVYPRTDRNALLLKGGPNAGGPLPISDWANEFADQMPDAILQAIRAARAGHEGELSDDSWRDRLAERLGSRWRIPKLLARRGGALGIDPVQPAGSSPITTIIRRVKRPATPGGTGGRQGDPGMAISPGAKHPATRVKVSGGIPHYRTVRA